jgi:hypothetical protein
VEFLPHKTGLKIYRFFNFNNKNAIKTGLSTISTYIVIIIVLKYIFVIGEKI